MKKSNKIIAAAATVAVAAMPFGNVFAATTPTWDGSSSVTIRRQIANAYGTINNTFTYTITADSNNPAGATGTPTTASIAFADSYTTQGTATKTTTLDFSAMQFTAVGDYTYAIAETASTYASVYPVDSANTYTAIVSVRNNADLTGYVASLYIKDKNGDKLTVFSGNSSQFLFARTPAYTNIQVSHTVSGNAADPNKCFSYTFAASTNDSYVLSTESTCGNGGTIKNGDVIKLKHQDTATIGLVRAGSQIPVGTTYSFTRVGSDAYTTSMDGVERTSTGTKTMVATDAPTFNAANKTAIDEKLDSTVDTGIAMNIAIYILLALAGAAGIYYVGHRKADNEA